jgi:hypothetical protein
MKQQYLFLGAGMAVVVLISVVVYLMLPGDDPAQRQFRERRDLTPAVRDMDENVLASIQFEDLGEGALQRVGDLTFEQTIALLRKLYGARLQHAGVRVQMIEELIRHLKERHPDDWVAKLQEILHAAFPDQAAELFRLSARLYDYESAVTENQAKLAGMNAAERQAYLWDLRDSIFGAEAQDVWASQFRSERVAAELGAIAANAELDVQEKVQEYRAAILEQYGDGAGRTLEARRQEFTNAFVDAVQSDFASMEANERREAYRSIWNTMGYPADAIERLDNLETKRDQRWSNGAVYMAEREKIEAEYSGPEREQRLDQLRRSLFGDEAETIKAEEDGGFDRFARQRRYGRD